MENIKQSNVITANEYHNGLIAEFMGVNVITLDDVRENNKNYYSSRDGYLNDDLKYHTSWDWLMPVIDKIGDHFTSTTIEMLAEYYYKDGDNQDGLDGIEEFYEAVVFWIKENNNNYKTI